MLDAMLDQHKFFFSFHVFNELIHVIRGGVAAIFFHLQLLQHFILEDFVSHLHDD